MKHTLLILALGYLNSIYCQPLDTLEYITHVNSKIGYQIEYPATWFVKHPVTIKKGDTLTLEYLSIENLATEVIIAGGKSPTLNGTVMQIEILHANINRAYKVMPDSINIKTIQEWIIYCSLPEQTKQQRLLHVHNQHLSGKTFSVYEGHGWADCGMEFIYQGKFFRLHFSSGSKEQFIQDKAIYYRMIESIKFIEN